MAYNIEYEDSYGDKLRLDLDMVQSGHQGKQYAAFKINDHDGNVILNIKQVKKLRRELKEFTIKAKVQEAADAQKGE